MAALHQNAGAAERERLLDLLEDHRLRQEVALAAVSGAAVERAEVAVGVPDVRVVDVAVDDERDPVGIGAARTQLVRGAAHRDQVARLEQRDRVVVGDSLAGEGAVEDLTAGGTSCRRHQTVAPALTNLSSGT